MFKKVYLAEKLRKISSYIESYAEFNQNSPYTNIPYYMTRIDPSDHKERVMPGPPSMYNDYDPEDRLKNKEDMRRQGPHPGPVDIFTKDYPVTDTVFPNDEVKTDAQGEPHDTTTPGGRNENRETIPFDPGALDIENYDTYYG